MRIAIIGGGISGLTTAYRLAHSSLGGLGKLEIHVYEASERFGGVIKTTEQGGFITEGGPDAFITAKPWALELCKELGLEGELLQTNPEVRQSFILSRNKLMPVPRGFYLMSPGKVSDVIRTSLLSWPGKLRMASELLIPRKKDVGDESLASFVTRRFGRELLERIAQPMIAGIYSADPEELGLEATFPDFLKMEQKHGSVIRGLGKKKDAATQKASGPRYSLFLTLKGGLSAMTEALIKSMPEVYFHSQTKLINIEPSSGWRLSFEGVGSIDADVVCFATPSIVAGRFVQPFAPELSKALCKIPYENVATLNLAFKRSAVKHPLDGFGYVVPAIENKKIVGCTFSSVKFLGRAKEDDTVLLRAFIGGKSARSLLSLSDEQITQAVSDELSLLLNISEAPLFSSLQRWPASIPQYLVGHKQTVSTIFRELKKYPGLFLTGNAYEGTGVPDCIQHASHTAKQIVACWYGADSRVKVKARA